jgi:hypothetical protein
MRQTQLLIVLAATISSPLVIAAAGIVLALIVGVGAFFIIRSSGKAKKANKAAAPGASSDWQRQAQQGTPGAWGQQGMGADNAWGAQNAQQQPGGWNAQGATQQPGWGTPGSPQQQPGGWNAQGATQQPGWGTPGSPQQQPGGWNTQGATQQPGWGTPGSPQQQPGGWNAQDATQQPGWNAPAASQPLPGSSWSNQDATQQAGWGSSSSPQQPAGPWSSGQTAPPASAGTGNTPSWDAQPPKDPWNQSSAAPPQQNAPAWGTQASTPSSQAPAAFNANSANQQWGGQTAQPAANAWSQNPFQQSAAPTAQPNQAVPSWQQPDQGFAAGAPGGFLSGDADKTMLRSGPVGRLGIVRVKEGKEPGRVYEVRKSELSIGRSRDSDIFLEDLAVSRLHAKIISEGSGNYALKDEGSANGTKINGALVNRNQKHPLQEGDEIQLGQTVLVFARQ